MKILEIFGAITALSVLLVPFYLLIRLQKRNEWSIKKLLLEKCKTEGIIPGFTELLDIRRIIGFDNQKRKLIFLNTVGGNVYFESIDLSKVQQCEIRKKNIQLKTNNKSRTTIETLDLVIALKAQVYISPIVINFFNYHIDEPLKVGFYEMKAVEWKENIHKIRDQFTPLKV